jgi:hypothetical protein
MYINRKKPDRFGIFRQSLTVRGYANYEEYLDSKEWMQFKSWYRKSGLPQACLVCRSPDVVLHHWNYDHVGCEYPCDVIPLCQQHHTDIHVWMKQNDVSTKDVVRCLCGCFGMASNVARSLFSPFRSFLFRTKHVNRRRCPKCGRHLPDGHLLMVCWSCHKEQKDRERLLARPARRKVRNSLHSSIQKVRCSKCLAMRLPEDFIHENQCCVCDGRDKRRLKDNRIDPAARGGNGLRDAMYLRRVHRLRSGRDAQLDMGATPNL